MQILQRSFSVILLLIFLSAFTISAQDKFTTPSEIRSLSWNPYGTQIAVGFYNGDVEIIDAQTRNVTMTLEADLFDVQQLAWSPNGNFLASGCYDGNVIIWDTSNGDEVAIVNGLSDSTISVLSWSSDNQYLLIFQNNGVNFTVWDMASHSIIHTERTSTIYDIVWQEDGIAFYLSNLIGGIDIRSSSTFNRIGYLGRRLDEIDSPSIQGGQILTIDMNTSNNQIMIGTIDGNVQLWDLSTGQPIYEVQGSRSDSLIGSIREVWFDNQDTVFYSLNTSGNLRSWTVASGELLTDTIITNQPINFAAVSPDRTRLAYVTAGTPEIDILLLQ